MRFISQKLTDEKDLGRKLGRSWNLLFEAKALDRTIVEQVFLNDFEYIIGGDVTIPDLLGVDHDRAAVFALIEAPGGVGAHAPLEPTLGELLFEPLAHLLGALGGAGTLWVRRISAVGADEDVLVEMGHPTSFYSVFSPPPPRSSSRAMMSFWISLVPS